MLLPPGWQAMNGKPLEEIAAWQWQQANTIVLDDLERLPRSRWSVIRYEELLQDAREAVGRIFGSLGLEVDAPLQQRLLGALPNSRYTLTAPDPQKWRAHADAIERVLPSVESIWQRLRQLQ
jgi:hypothetical protein